MKEIERLQSLCREQAQPGPEHKMLEKMAGAWSQDIRLWPEPGAEPMITKGTIEWELLLGGRFLQGYSRLDGSDEVTGVSLLGFDRRSGRYTCLGMDAVGTYWVSAEGAPGADGEPIVMAGRDDNPSLNHTQIYDFVLRWLDDNTDSFCGRLSRSQRYHSVSRVRTGHSIPSGCLAIALRVQEELAL